MRPLKETNTTWQRFKSNKMAMAGMSFIVFMTIVALLGYNITPDSTPYANNQIVELSAKKPGFKVQMIKIRKNDNLPKQSFFKTMFVGKPSGFKHIPINSFTFNNGQITINEYTGFDDEVFSTEYQLADILFPLDENIPVLLNKDEIIFTTVDGEKHSKNISELQKEIESKNIVTKKYVLGTDRFGRDLLSRLIIGARVSLAVGFVSVFISLFLGLILGLCAGYFKGIVDKVIMWIVNVVWSIPTLLIAIAITMVLGKGFWQLFIAIGLTMWVEVARVVRGQVLSIREKEYIDAARVLGFSNLRILFKQILPNVINPVLIISAANFASAILVEAGLSFLGIGIQPPVPSWGGMIKDHYGYIIVDMAYLAVLPGLGIMLMVLSFTFIGNGLRDALDVKN